MKPTEADEPGSEDYNRRLWRRTRNEKIIMQTQNLKEVAKSRRWDVQAGFFDNGSQPHKICFHQFEDHLLVADDRDTINVWDWRNGSRLNRFSNGNPSGAKINDLRLINEDDSALLMTGSADGIVKIYRNYESRQDVQLVSTFRALTDMQPRGGVSGGLVAEWLQGQGKLIVGGDEKVIRVWNAATETNTEVIPARSGSCITSLSADQVAGQIFVAGYADGAVRVFDMREAPRDAMVITWKEHKAWIVKAHIQRGGQRELVTGDRQGVVKIFDIRHPVSLSTIQATRESLRSLSVHEHAPVFAA
jgi:regulatory associated protein of mTOR